MFKESSETLQLLAPLVCTLKSDLEVATWDFLGHELEKIYNHPDFFSAQAADFFSDLPYETKLFLRLPPWKYSGWILLYLAGFH